jgi:hypothetical protein
MFGAVEILCPFKLCVSPTDATNENGIGFEL